MCVDRGELPEYWQGQGHRVYCLIAFRREQNLINWQSEIRFYNKIHLKTLVSSILFSDFESIFCKNIKSKDPIPTWEAVIMLIVVSLGSSHHNVLPSHSHGQNNHELFDTLFLPTIYHPLLWEISWLPQFSATELFPSLI